jgi:hypothetical protein
MWVNQSKNLGRIQQGTKHDVLFLYDGIVPEDFKVTKIEASCGCTTPVFDRGGKVLRASFTAPNVPKHLLYKGEYTSTKKVIMYTSAGDFTFTFKATIAVKL